MHGLWYAGKYNIHAVYETTNITGALHIVGIKFILNRPKSINIFGFVRQICMFDGQHCWMSGRWLMLVVYPTVSL